MYYLSRHTNIMTEKVLNIFDECAAKCLHPSTQKENASVLPEGTVKCTQLAAKKIHRGRKL